MIQQGTKPRGLPAALAGEIDQNVIRLIMTLDEWGDYALVMPNPPTVEALTSMRDAIDLAIAEHEALLQEQEAAKVAAPKPKRRTRKKKVSPEE